MSLAGLVQYDSSDDNSDKQSDNEDTSEKIVEINNSRKNIIDDSNETQLNIINVVEHEKKLILPDPVHITERLESTNSVSTDCTSSFSKLSFNVLPQPMKVKIQDNEEIQEDEDDIPAPKITQFVVEKPPKKEKGPVKISIPSLSDFDDVDETSMKKKTIQPSKKMPGVLALLPPPKSEIISTANSTPNVLTKLTHKSTPLIPRQIKNNSQNPPNVNKNNTTPKLMKPSAALNSLNYDSNTDDEDDETCKSIKDKSIDFFSLSEPVNLPLSEEIVAANILPLPEKKLPTELMEKSSEINENREEISNKMLTSTVMNLPKNEILLKNKAEVGPKLPVPEQEFNIDTEGNVAFDDKAIEYLCGKRGVKRKNEIINENEIIDINGEDMKPDEREWLVKALTEEPIRKPISLGSGPSGQSKKKHQITYLAHQAKAMEIELQNQWASSNMARRQTRSKYGF